MPLPTAPLIAPSPSDRFALLGKLGEGHRGEVWLAEDTTTRRRVALKKFRNSGREFPDLRRRIMHEYLVHTRIGPHRNIVSVIERLETPAEVVFVMEYVEGMTLSNLMRACHREKVAIGAREVLTIAAQILDALARIHSIQIIHRDVKPDNIMVAHVPGEGLVAKLLDFGIARDHRHPTADPTHATGLRIGTPTYMSPEQLEPMKFGDVTAASDLYAVGIVLFELLTGRPPFTGETAEVAFAHARKPAPRLARPDLGAAEGPLADLVETLLAKSPRDRPKDARVVRDQLKKLLPTLPSNTEAELKRLLMTAHWMDQMRASSSVVGVDVGGRKVLANMPAADADATGNRRAWFLGLVAIILAAVAAVAWWWLGATSSR